MCVGRPAGAAGSLKGGGVTLVAVPGAELDLKVFDSNGTQVGYSGSWDNSDEVAEFTGVPGQTYDIHIRRWSGSRDVWYGIAWTVTGGLLISLDPDIVVTRAERPVFR